MSHLDELFEDPDALVLLRDGLEGGVPLQVAPDVLPRRLLAHAALVQQVPEGRLQLLALPQLLLDPLALLRLRLLLQRDETNSMPAMSNRETMAAWVTRGVLTFSRERHAMLRGNQIHSVNV